MNEGGMLTHVAVIDSEPLLRAAWEKLLRSFTSCWVAGSYSSFDDFYIRNNGYPFDVFLMHVADSWPIKWTALRSIRSHKPETDVVVILSTGAIRYASAAVQNGARSVVSTAADPQELQEAILAAACNKSYFCRMAASAIRVMQEEEERSDNLNELSNRESDVLSLSARGMRLKEIAEHLGVNVKSAHSYRVRAMQKLGLQNTAQIIRYVVERELRESPEKTPADETGELAGITPVEDD